MDTPIKEALEAVLPFFEPEIRRGPAIDEWNAACLKLKAIATYNDEDGIWKLKEERKPDPHFRIGQLEGAIKGAIEELSALVEAVEHPRPAWVKKTTDEGRQVIAKLKELIQP